MGKRTMLLLAVVCAVTLSASISCGGKNPTEPTKGATSAPVGVAGGDDQVTAMATSTMRWTISDRCTRDGVSIQWRLFDVVANKRYPASGVYRTPNGGSKTATISCTTRNKICVGGTIGSRLSFGVGINGTRRSGTILRSLFCRSCSNVRYGLYYSCSRLDGLAPGDEGWTEEESPLLEDDLAESLVDSEGEEFIE